MLVNASFQVGFQTSPTYTSCTIAVRLSDPLTGATSLPHDRIIKRGDQKEYAATYVFPVVGGVRSFVVEADDESCGAGATIAASAPELTALYVLFGYDGGTTLAPTP